MSQTRNNLDALQRRAATRGPVSLSSATPVQKASKFKPAKAGTPSSAPARKTATTLARLPSFSTPGFGKSKPTPPNISRTLRPTASADAIDISSSESAPPSPSVPSKRISSDANISSVIPVSPKRQKLSDAANKENVAYAASKPWKGKEKETYAGDTEEAVGSTSAAAAGNSSVALVPYRRPPAPAEGDHADLRMKSLDGLRELFKIDHQRLQKAREDRMEYRIHGNAGDDPYILEHYIKLLEGRVAAIDAAMSQEEEGRSPPVIPPTTYPPIASSGTASSSRTFIIASRSPAADGSSPTLVSVSAPHSASPPPKFQPAFPAADETTYVEDKDGTPSDDELWHQMEEPPLDIDDEEELESPEVISALSAPPPPSLASDAEFTGNPLYAEAVARLKSVFKLSDFRPMQLGPIISTLQGHDVVVFLPTGGGKSLCFQLPAVCTGGKTKGVTVVICPLLALMQNQVTSLEEKGIDAVQLLPESTMIVRSRLLRENSCPAMLYVTPEKLSAGESTRHLFGELYKRGMLARFVVDEAHLISSWGRDFREEGYTGLTTLRTDYPGIPIMAVTATATPDVQQDIINTLKMKTPKIFSQSFNRPNLRYHILNKPKGAVGAIIQYIKQSHPRDAGIVYCLSRDSCERVADEMVQSGLKARHYHALVPKDEQKATSEAWMRGECHIIVATIAFGMGIDKPDVRFVIHHDTPMSIASYNQETGRAGRDGKTSDCVLYYTWNEKTKYTRFIEKDENLRPDQKEQQIKEIDEMFQFCLNRADCRRTLLLRKFGEQFNQALCESTCDNCLSVKDTVSEDMTDAALRFVRYIQAAYSSGPHMSKTNLVLGFRGSKSRDVRDKGLDALDGYGEGKELEQSLVSRLFDELVSRNIVGSFSVTPPGSRFASSYVKPGPEAQTFLRTRPQLIMRTRPKQTVRPPGSQRAPASSKAPRSKRKGPRQELADDPVEDDTAAFWMDDDDFPEASTSAAPPPPPPANVETRRPKRAKPTVDPEDPVFDLTEEATPADDDLNAQCYKELLALRTKERESDPNLTADYEVLDDETVQLLSVMLPADAQSFKNAIAAGPDAGDKEKYRSYGRSFLDVTTRYAMLKGSETANASTSNSSTGSKFHPASLHDRFGYKSSSARPPSKARG